MFSESEPVPLAAIARLTAASPPTALIAAAPPVAAFVSSIWLTALAVV